MAGPTYFVFLGTLGRNQSVTVFTQTGIHDVILPTNVARDVMTALASGADGEETNKQAAKSSNSEIFLRNIPYAMIKQVSWGKTGEILRLRYLEGNSERKKSIFCEDQPKFQACLRLLSQIRPDMKPREVPVGLFGAAIGPLFLMGITFLLGLAMVEAAQPGNQVNTRGRHGAIKVLVLVSKLLGVGGTLVVVGLVMLYLLRSLILACKNRGTYYVAEVG